MPLIQRLGELVRRNYTLVATYSPSLKYVSEVLSKAGVPGCLSRLSSLHPPYAGSLRKIQLLSWLQFHRKQETEQNEVF